jgi:Thiamine biosynthesis enzyme ThiH and related uncharacterized enzymes
MEQIEHEMKVIADSGMEEILILTGESRAKSSVEYIGEACKLARKYFRMVGVEVYPVNTDEYRYLHECGVDYVYGFPGNLRQGAFRTTSPDGTQARIPVPSLIPRNRRPDGGHAWRGILCFARTFGLPSRCLG